MRRILFLTSTLMVLLTSACSINHKSIFKPFDPIINKDPQKLYANKQYDLALMAMLEADPRQLEDPAKRKLLRNINGRLVTVQGYLQKSIIALMEGHKTTALKHVDKALELYPDHQASLLFKKQLDTIRLKIDSKRSKPPHKKKTVKKIPSKEDLDRANYYLITGKAYLESGQLSLAKAAWLQGLGIVPSHKSIKENLVKLITNEGLQLFGQGDITASIKKWEEALKIKPNDPEIKGYLDKARKADKKVRSID